MIRGLYTAATGMLAEQYVQDAIAGNLANLNTVGFKQDIPTFRALHDMAMKRFQNPIGSPGTPVGSLGMGAEFDRNVTDLSAGNITQTQNPLDVALVGDGFFAIQTPQGERYTRSGQFQVGMPTKDAGGAQTTYLVDENGNKVLGQKGPISLGGAKEIVIDSKGGVVVDGKQVDTLKLVNAPVTALKKEGGNLYSVQGAPTASTAAVRQGYLEQSNVNAIGTMVRMITVQRAYEAAQKAVIAQDDTLGRAVNDVPRV